MREVVWRWRKTTAALNADGAGLERKPTICKLFTVRDIDISSERITQWTGMVMPLDPCSAWMDVLMWVSQASFD